MIEKNQAMLKIIFITIIVMLLLKICLVFLWPFAITIILITMLEPLVKALCRIGFERKISVVIGFVLMITGAFLIVYFTWNYIYSQVVYFLKKLPEIILLFSQKFKLPGLSKLNSSQLINALENIIPEYREKIFNTLVSTINSFVYIIFICMTTILLSMDLNRIIHLLKRILPGEFYCIIDKVIKKNISIMKVEFKLVCASTIQTILGLYILGIPNSLTIGLICGILDILPVVGTSLIFFPWILLEFANNHLFTSIGLLLLYILLEVNRQIMEIKFMGRNLHIQPIYTVLSLYLGLVIYGIWGVLLGPFVIILIRELFNYYYKGERGKGI